MCVRSAVSLGRRRSSVSGGGARGGARARPAAAERPQRARSDERPQWSLRRPRRRSAAPAGAQRRRHRCKCRCCYTLAYRVCRCSPAAACFCYRLVASNPLCHQTYTLCRTVFGVLSALALAKAESLFGRGKIERTRPAAHEPAQDSSEYSGGTGLCVTLTVSATGRRAPAHPHKPPKAAPAAAATPLGKHTRQLTKQVG